jgi:luciferase family oxidoreductase group 1
LVLQGLAAALETTLDCADRVHTSLQTEASMQHFSLLDLSPVPEGKTTADALANSVALARAAENAGYHRYWLAEHHNMAGIASAATAVVIGHVAAATRTMRVGAGGIMLPNHAPLVIAEQFGTLATLYGDRIDLGLGRAPGAIWRLPVRCAAIWRPRIASPKMCKS